MVIFYGETWSILKYTLRLNTSITWNSRKHWKVN